MMLPLRANGPGFLKILMRKAYMGRGLRLELNNRLTWQKKIIALIQIDQMKEC